MASHNSSTSLSLTKIISPPWQNTWFMLVVYGVEKATFFTQMCWRMEVIGVVCEGAHRNLYDLACVGVCFFHGHSFPEKIFFISTKSTSWRDTAGSWWSIVKEKRQQSFDHPGTPSKVDMAVEVSGSKQYFGGPPINQLMLDSKLGIFLTWHTMFSMRALLIFCVPLVRTFILWE